MQKLLNKITCGDCIEVFGKVNKSFSESLISKVLKDLKNNGS